VKDAGVPGRATADRGTDNRAIGNRGTADAGIPDAGLPSAASSKLGVATTTLLVFQTGSDSLPESRNICSESATGTWRKNRFAASLEAAIVTTRDISGSFSITSFAVLAHGNVGGRFNIGPDTVDPSTLPRYVRQFTELSRILAPQADIFIFGCASGFEEGGSVLLKELSKLLTGRRVIGFSRFNAVNPKGSRRESGRICFDPDVWCSDVTSSLEALNAQAKGKPLFINPATDSAPQAKIAKDGAIVKWPAGENPRKHDANLKDVIKRFGG
jgi:Domain of unknown function (DUF4347)